VNLSLCFICSFELYVVLVLHVVTNENSKFQLVTSPSLYILKAFKIQKESSLNNNVVSAFGTSWLIVSNG